MFNEIQWSLGSSVSIVTRLWAGWPGFDCRQGFVLSVTASRPTPGHTQPPIQWEPGVKRLGRKANNSLHLMPRLKMEWTYTSTPPYVFMA